MGADGGVRGEIESRFRRAQDRLVLQAADLSLETLSNMVKDGSIDIAPGYQRRERWTHQKQSALIESFLLNIPIPPTYLSEDEYGTYSVIDGKQRLTAIHRFMGNELPLGTLETFHELEGLRFADLPSELGNALRVRPYLRAVTLLKQSDPQLKYEVFARLNRGGEPLNAQEIRNVLYRGSLNELIYELAEHAFLKQQLKIQSTRSSAYRSMQDAEYVLRFLTLVETWERFSGDYRRSMDDFMREHQKASPQELTSFRNLFLSCLETAEIVWGKNSFRRPAGGYWRDQTLAGMFDAQMVALALLTEDERDALPSARESVVESTKSLFVDTEFEASVREATNTPGRVIYRITRMHEVLRQSLV